MLATAKTLLGPQHMLWRRLLALLADAADMADGDGAVVGALEGDAAAAAAAVAAAVAGRCA